MLLLLLLVVRPRAEPVQPPPGQDPRAGLLLRVRDLGATDGAVAPIFRGRRHSESSAPGVRQNDADAAAPGDNVSWDRRRRSRVVDAPGLSVVSNAAVAPLDRALPEPVD